MTDIEIPLERDRHGWYRFFEILPGAISWFMLVLPVLLSFVVINLFHQVKVSLATIFVFVYLLINFLRGLAGVVRAMQGYRKMRQHQQLPWPQMLAELEAGRVDPRAKRPRWHTIALERTRTVHFLKPSEVIHAVIIATYKETKETLAPTFESVLASDFNMKQVIVILAYEERGGESTEVLANELVGEYGDRFLTAMAIKHPKNIPDEIIGKGGNVTYAGRRLQSYLVEHKIDPKRVMVTTLDADNRPDKHYLTALSYAYVAAPDPLHASYQPVSLYTNNIWDAPAPMRVVATGNSLFNLVISLRQHALRNFSSHAQPMAALIETDFWSVRTIVEDGHQFWRSYFTFDGNYRVYPLHLPICQDAVLADGYVKTLRAQFKQLQRWTYGASDVAYVVNQGYFKPNQVPRFDLFTKLWRLLEGHVTWAVGPLLVLSGGFIPSHFNPNVTVDVALPQLVSLIQEVALVFAIGTVFLSLKTLPPKPLRYRRHRTIWMVLQYVYLPVTTLAYNSSAAFYSQTRLMFRRYVSKFDVTEKAVIKDSGELVTSGKDS